MDDEGESEEEEAVAEEIFDMHLPEIASLEPPVELFCQACQFLICLRLVMMVVGGASHYINFYISCDITSFVVVCIIHIGSISFSEI